jgi:rod shape determining protein RodA
LLIPFAASALPLSLILLQPDLGTVLLLIPVLLSMLFLAGARLRHLGVLALLGVALVPPAWGKIRGYQRARVTAVLLQSDSLREAVIANPERFKSISSRRQAMEWEAASGYQLVHAKNAVGSGGFVGMGWGRGRYMTSHLLPDRHNDFVFAIVGHQWGLLGCLVVLTCYGVLAVVGVRVSSATPEPVGRLLAAGVTVMMAVQALVNMAMTVGLMPITGMTLPFVSYGGSSLLTNAIAVALLVSVSRSQPFMLASRPFEQESATIQRPPLAQSVQRPVPAGLEQGCVKNKG